MENTDKVRDFLLFIYDLKEGIAMPDLNACYDNMGKFNLYESKVDNKRYFFDYSQSREDNTVMMSDIHTGNRETIKVDDLIPVLDLEYVLDVLIIAEKADVVLAYSEYLKDHLEDIHLTKMFSSNEEIIKKIGKKSEFNLDDILPLIDLIKS